MPAFELRLNVLNWEAWAEGLADKQAWRDWAGGGGRWNAPEGKGPPAAQVAPIFRRRAGLSDRLALEVACRLVASGEKIPSVFASRHGQIRRSVGLLEDLAAAAPLSPMDFSVSVHNATAGLFTISRGDRSGTTALAGGREAFSSGLLEAQGLVAEGAERVLVVYHDEAPPAVLEGRWDGETAGWSLGLLLGASGGRTLVVSLEDSPDRQGADAEPQALSLARLLAQDGGEVRWSNARHVWTWRLEP